jgi:two-component system, NarL family, response regulator NreC
MANQNLPQLKVLIVDDTASVRVLVKEYLRRNKNIIVGEAENRDEALSQTKEFTPDVVLMDISLDGINGVEVTRQIKSDYPHIRVYLFSAYNMDEYRNIKTDTLCDGFIQKSSLKTELYQMIQTELKRKEASQVIKS